MEYPGKNHTEQVTEIARRRAFLRLAAYLSFEQLKVFLRNAIQLPDLVGVLRWTGVQLVHRDQEFANAGREAEFQRSFAHTAVVTGLARQEVSDLVKHAQPPHDPDGSSVNRLVRIMTAWATEKAYLDDVGKPRDIRLCGPAPSFERLCREHGRDVPARPIADALVRNGNAEWVSSAELTNSDKKLRFRRRVVTADLGSLENVEIFTQIGCDFMHSYQKMFGEVTPQPRFREAYFNDVDADKAAEARSELHELIQRFSSEAHDLLERFRTDDNKKHVRMGVGAYSFFQAPLVIGNSLDQWTPVQSIDGQEDDKEG